MILVGNLREFINHVIMEKSSDLCDKRRRSAEDVPPQTKQNVELRNKKSKPEHSVSLTSDEVVVLDMELFYYRQLANSLQVNLSQ